MDYEPDGAAAITTEASAAAVADEATEIMATDIHTAAFVLFLAIQPRHNGVGLLVDVGERARVAELVAGHRNVTRCSPVNFNAHPVRAGHRKLAMERGP